jgi:hypothetical protein
MSAPRSECSHDLIGTRTVDRPGNIDPYVVLATSKWCGLESFLTPIGQGLDSGGSKGTPTCCMQAGLIATNSVRPLDEQEIAAGRGHGNGSSSARSTMIYPPTRQKATRSQATTPWCMNVRTQRKFRPWAAASCESHSLESCPDVARGDWSTTPRTCSGTDGRWLDHLHLGGGGCHGGHPARRRGSHLNPSKAPKD